MIEKPILISFWIFFIDDIDLTTTGRIEKYFLKN